MAEPRQRVPVEVGDRAEGEREAGRGEPRRNKPVADVKRVERNKPFFVPGNVIANTTAETRAACEMDRSTAVPGLDGVVARRLARRFVIAIPSGEARS